MTHCGNVSIWALELREHRTFTGCRHDYARVTALADEPTDITRARRAVVCAEPTVE
jgi:hypothetical protein